jgi:UDP-N-acetylmuramoylalanine--D-glutamate ligase
VTSYDGLRVVVAGAGISGAAAAAVLRERGADVSVVDARGGEGVVVTDTVPAGTDLVVTSPGWRPDAPLLLDAAGRDIEVIGEVELAWRLSRELPAPAPWLAITGTNGKTTTVGMLASILTAALDPSYDVLAVELSSFQLHWSASLRPLAAAVLNVAPDHLDWHGSMAAYAAAKARIWAGETSIGNADDEVTRTLLSRAPGRRVTFTLRTPRASELGLVEDLLVDRAFADVPGEATELATLGDLTVTGGHNVANALAAAALARAYGVSAQAVRDGLRRFVADPHRNAVVAQRDGVTWVDDSKATNPHAAAASLAAYDRIVWVAGGLLKGADVEDLVREAAPRLAAVILLGSDRQPFRDALSRHAPDVPVVEVDRLDTEAMSEVVAAARRLARPGDTVLLAPAAASMDCFRDYKERGDLFAALAAG